MRARESPGLVGDVASVAANGLRAVRTRLELVSIELKEEKAWVMRFLIVSIAAVYLVSFGTLLAILALSLAVPELTRPMVLGGFGGAMLVVGAGAIAWIVASARHRARPFDDTISVLKRDEEALRGEAGE